MCDLFATTKHYRVKENLLINYDIINRSNNGYETVGNIKVVSIDSFKQLEVANKVDYVTN